MQVPGSANALMLGGAKDYTIARSLRFRRSATGYLSRSPASATNRTKWTWSGWVKRGLIGSTVYPLFSSYIDTSRYSVIDFSSDVIRVLVNNGGSEQGKVTTPVYRDPSSWYHVVVSADNGVSALNIYINGLQVTSFSSNITVTQSWQFNNTTAQWIGREQYGASNNYFDGYLADVNFIDGQALTPSSFGETDLTTGVWKPKKYAGTYGTNGFYLNFSDNSAATAAAIGKDYSGNGNNWTPNNISVTSGATYDSMTDVPTLTSATAANYCVMNPLDKASSFTISNGNLTVDINAARPVFASVKGTIGITSGKWYWEFVKTTAGSAVSESGVWATDNLLSLSTDLNGTSGSLTNIGAFGSTASSVLVASGLSSVTTFGSYTNGDVIGIAFDADAGKLYAYKNGVEFTGQTQSSGTSILPTMATGKTYQPFVYCGNGGGGTELATTNINFGQRPFAYTPPTGFVALNTFNLPDPTIKKPSSNFDAVTYSGTGATRTVTTGFQPDFTWIKSRSSADNHNLQDSVRGANKTLRSDSTLGETTETQNLISFDSSGITIGSGNGVNINGGSFVTWNWKANGAAVSNTAGSITASVSANASAGFSIVTYTGTGANATVGHGLGVAPKMIIVKNRSSGASNWLVYHASLTSNLYYLSLNTTDAQSNTSGSLVWNSTSPTSSVFSVGAAGSVNGNTNNHVAYCFSEVAGYSKFGSYVGNGSADGTFVHCGFRPRYILIKASSNSTSSTVWAIYDTARNTYNASVLQLYANASTAEETDSAGIDILSNGFKMRRSSEFHNNNGWTYIYAAFAENPSKYALAR